MKRVMMLVAVVGGIVQMAVGADTHDYSNYIVLNCSPTVSNHWPTADQWNPVGEMNEDGYYLIPKGKTLTTKTGGVYGDGGSWPMAEMAIAGKFAASASGSRNGVAITPRLALCAGGTIALSSAYGTIKGDTLDIRGTTDDPSLFTYGYTSANDKPNYYAQVLSTLTASDPDALVKFTRTATDGWDLQRAYRVKGFSDYLGSVIVEGEHAWLRPETSATEFIIGGTLELKDGGNFYVDTVSPTVGSLTVGEGSTLQLAKAKTVTVNGAVSIAEGAVIVVDDIAKHASVWDGSAAPVVKFLSVCGADNAAAVDRAALLAAVVRGGKVFTGTTEDGTPKLTLAETMRADGGVDFAVSHETVASLTLKSGDRFVVSKPLSFTSLTMEAGATLEIAEGQTLTLTGPFTFAEGATIIVDGLESTPFVYDNGSNAPAQVPFLSFAQASDAEAVDRAALLAAVIRSGKVFSGTLASEVPRLCIVRDGGDFMVSHDPIVKQTKNCGSGTGPWGNGQYEGFLTDNSPLSPDKDYTTAGFRSYCNNSFTFPGRSWTVSGPLGLYGRTVEVADLRLTAGSYLRQMSKDASLWLKGKACLYGSFTCAVCGAGTHHIDSDLSGTGDLIVALDVAKAAEKTVSFSGKTELGGDNVLWKGRALVGCGTSTEFGYTNVTLSVSAARNLGGGLDAPVFDSLKVADTCTFAVTDSTTFEAANRGWCLMDGSTVSVSADKTVTANETVTFGGTVTKVGVGALVLGGPSKAYDAENDAPVDTPNGAELVVAAGGLGATATDAFAGLSSLTFAAGTKYFASAANASGTDLSAVALTLPAGGVPVEFTDIPENRAAITVATFATAEDAAKFTFVKPRGYIVTRSVEEVDGKFALKAEIEKSGVVLIVR